MSPLPEESLCNEYICSTCVCECGSMGVSLRFVIAGTADGDRVKKHQQAVVGFLEANRISFQEVDITMLEEQRLWMYRNIPRDKQPEKGNPLPPQIFNEDRYCGDYEDFFQSKENNTVFTFLGLSSQPSVKDSES
ncbi:SH3 domain-binding glutamic acid-rich-like protein 2 isoform X1 [Sparus aurata]|uniref:SH3 domain-binding glutamic acid-rich-like protein 2 isoform X1 n=1 Tax=Sparus aurata TaxID=8175 RepID=UPI0011C13060|nr:SH3 domain-binding glutamic acid-rich-like protein 2 isoform X1 [Sparus aurata]